MSATKEHYHDEIEKGQREAAAKVCETKDHSCVYHACMSEHCQKEEVLKYTSHLGKGKCEK